MALGFRDDEALRVVLTSGLCPPDVQAKGARVARDGAGRIVLAPDQPMPAAAVASLRAAGIATDAELPANARAVRCWAEAVALVRVPAVQIPALVLVTTPTADSVVDLSAELLRLGCERQELLVGAAGGVIRVTDPPTYTMMRALDRDAGLRAYAPDPAGQDAVFTELGYRHPLASRLRPEPGQLLLVGTDGWRSVEDRGWRGLEAALELAIPRDRVELVAQPLTARRRVELRLAPGRREAASLWVLRRGGVAALDKLLAYLPEEVVARLAFAATASTGDEPPVIVLRARASRHPPPDLSLDAEVYAPLAHLPDVYAPAGAIVEPPLRRERLRAILGVEPGQVAWLAPVDAAAGASGAGAGATAGHNRGPFRVEKISDAAFAPLAEWSEYIIHASAHELVPWMRAATFELTPFVSTGLEWATSGASEREPTMREPRGRARPQRRGGAAPAMHSAESVAPSATAATQPRERRQREEPARVEEIAIDEELVALENQFVSLDAPADAPERLGLLEQLGRAYARLGRRRDAGLCFARAVWELTGPAANERLDAWISAELRGTPVAAALDTALGQDAPATDDVRRVAAIAARAPDAVRRDPHRVQRWLDDHDRELDARSLWLARIGLARLAGGDALGLATARDRILVRFAGGLPVERELPSFLRFAGRSGALGNASGEQLAAALERLAEKIATTRRKRLVTDTRDGNTKAYTSLLLAHGFARIGQHERARALIRDTRTALADVIGDPVHAYLVAAFEARVEQAIAGHPRETPLPEALSAQFTALDRVKIARYVVDRLREASRILEPIERFDAIGAYAQRQQNGGGGELAALRAIADTAARAAEVARLIEVAAAADDAERVQLLDGCLDVLFALPEASAVPVLGRAVQIVETLPEPQRAVLYAEALVVAGHFGRAELIPALLESLGSAVRVVPGKALERVLDQSLRALRRIGLRNEMAELLADAEHALAGDATNLHARLALAGGLAFLGDTARAMPILDQARKALPETKLMPDRVALARALAQAYAQAPLGHALGGIAELSEQLRDITDNYSTNSHFCLSVLHFVESLVLGITSDDLALGEVGRRFVEDDEHLVRRRLHRDLGGPS